MYIIYIGVVAVIKFKDFKEMAEQEKDKFSFEDAPGKIGAGEDSSEKPASEFSFNDVPILGKKEKTSSIMDFLGGSSTPSSSTRKKRPQGQPEESPLELKYEKEPERGGQSNDILGTGGDEWTIAGPKKKKKMKRLVLILSVATLLSLVIVSVAVFFLMRQKENEDVPLPNKRLNKLEKEKARQEEKKRQFDASVTAAEKLVADGNITEAELALQKLIAEHPEKSLLYTISARLEQKKNNPVLAMENFIKAISAGAESSEAYVQLSALYLTEKKNAEALDICEKGIKKFPDDQALLKILAKLYLALDDKLKASEFFGKIDKTTLSYAEISDYAELLKAIGENRKAREVYVYAGKKFVDSALFEKALDVEMNPVEKNNIISVAITLFDKDPQKMNKMLILLVRDLMKTGRKDMAMEKLKMVDVEFLDADDSLFYVEKTIESTNDLINKDKIETIISTHNSDYAILKAIQNLLNRTGKTTLSAEIFSELWAKNPESAVCEYLYARSLDPLDSAIEYYSLAVKRKPDFQDALLDLGKCLISHRRYLEAEDILLKARQMNPDGLTINQNLFLSRFYRDRNSKTLLEYRKFLESKKIGKIPLLLMEYAQMLDDPSYSESLLLELEKSDKKAEQFWRIRHDLIYWNAPEKHFSEYYPPEARELYVLYLLSKGKQRDVLLLPTPPDKFPDFWKVFILWRSGMEGWEDMALAFYEKHKANSSLNMISMMILGKNDPDDAKRQIYRVEQEYEALFFLVMAEQYRKARLRIKAQVSYSKALGDAPGIYRKLIQYFENN